MVISLLLPKLEIRFTYLIHMQEIVLECHCRIYNQSQRCNLRLLRTLIFLLFLRRELATPVVAQNGKKSVV